MREAFLLDFFFISYYTGKRFHFSASCSSRGYYKQYELTKNIEKGMGLQRWNIKRRFLIV